MRNIFFNHLNLNYFSLKYLFIILIVLCKYACIFPKYELDTSKSVTATHRRTAAWEAWGKNPGNNRISIK